MTHWLNAIARTLPRSAGGERLLGALRRVEVLLATANRVASPAAMPAAVQTAGNEASDQQRAQRIDRLTGAVSSAARRGERAQVLHDRAGLRIDAALYELEQLRIDLQGIVPARAVSPPVKPVEGSSLERPAFQQLETLAETLAETKSDCAVRAGPAGSERSAA